ncbi:beta-ketoacyl synthase N-terminal-like domain-containing protein [Vallitalea guaymasensis]|uniref:beta-ketoacyl synthase N-terminal-like domain-containing protein n=1 Tax=Vallitalea guaymasensis TaxID=1185412 RepID=UPI000DE4788B|nr:beta-ketoacyl synthase N-terminal-like domain-containing protein [Vallitalea guaymasensis]
MYTIENHNKSDIVITGCGVTSAGSQGKKQFTSVLLNGKNNFGVMERPGRQKDSSYIGAEIPPLVYPEQISKKTLRTASFSGKAAMVTIDEAWNEAKLNLVDSERIGLIIGGSNFQQRELMTKYEKYSSNTYFIPPTYALSYMDSDVCGFCTQQYGINGLAYSVGGASASGQVAILQAIQAVQSGQVDVCIALGALMDLSYLECQAFRSLGAMGTERYKDEPKRASRPFDRDRDGFIFGECCGAVVIEKLGTAIERNIKPYASITGWSMVIDGNRNPNPSYEGEVKAIKEALQKADLEPEEIDYINPHGTGSIIGDETEVRAIHACKLNHAFINATKSVIGHGLSAAGTVEVIATLMQMKEGRLHPTRNLENPIDSTLNWIRQESILHCIQNAISLSIGFGGVNTALCLQRI